MYIHLSEIQILNPCLHGRISCSRNLRESLGGRCEPQPPISMPHHPETAAAPFPPPPVAPKARSVQPSAPPSTGCPRCSAASVRHLRPSRAHLLLRSQST